jgi:replication factor A3
MAEALSTPRISSRYLDAFTNRTVRLTGKVTQLRGEQATIDCNGNVTAILNRVCPLAHPRHQAYPAPSKPTSRGSREAKLTVKQDSHLTVGNAIEIVGKVNPDLSVRVLQSTDLGSDFGTFPTIYSPRPSSTGSLARIIRSRNQKERGLDLISGYTAHV